MFPVQVKVSCIYSLLTYKNFQQSYLTRGFLLKTKYLYGIIGRFNCSIMEENMLNWYSSSSLVSVYEIDRFQEFNKKLYKSFLLNCLLPPGCAPDKLVRECFWIKAWLTAVSHQYFRMPQSNFLHQKWTSLIVFLHSVLM